MSLTFHRNSSDASIETGFYYLQSRYYDPGTGRFINADSFASTGQGFLGYNMFAYCHNSPIVFSDPSGCIIVISTSNSEEDEDSNTLLYLRSLSDDIIIVVDGKLSIASYREGHRPTGTQLLRELIASEHIITIKATDGNSSRYSPDCEYIEIKGKYVKQPITNPVGGTVYLNFNDKNVANESRAMIVGHELIHAWRSTNRFSILSNPYERIERFGCFLEEVFTVGLDSVNYYSVYTENALRKEHGLILRTKY